MRMLALLLTISGRGSPDSLGTTWTYETPDVRVRVEVVATGFVAPVALSVLPDGRLLVADRPGGVLSILDPVLHTRTLIDSVPAVHGKVDGGLLDVLVPPDFERTGWIYLAMAVEVPGGKTMVVDRARLIDGRLADRHRLFSAQPVIDNSNEFGTRLVLDHGFLYVTVGQRNLPANAQDLGSDLGKIIRLRADGSIPPTNPFVHVRGARPEIWTYGNRNAVGLAIDPSTGLMWEHEHGPQGGDEINIIRRGRNYGWPVITYGVEYGGKPVGQGLRRHQGMEQPVFYYNPDIAPSGMIVYTGDRFPHWRGSIFLGALVGRCLDRLDIDRDHVIHEERLFEDRRWKVRAVQQAPDGSIYIGVDASATEAGMVLRLTPIEQ
jgi:glucose/arabinose dehydrogenase